MISFVSCREVRKNRLAFSESLCYDVKNNLKGNSMMKVTANSIERREEERRLL